MVWLWGGIFPTLSIPMLQTRWTIDKVISFLTNHSTEDRTDKLVLVFLKTSIIFLFSQCFLRPSTQSHLAVTFATKMYIIKNQ